MFWACPVCRSDISPVNGGNPSAPVTLTLEPPLNLPLEWGGKVGEGEGTAPPQGRSGWTFRLLKRRLSPE